MLRGGSRSLALVVPATAKQEGRLQHDCTSPSFKRRQHTLSSPGLQTGHALRVYPHGCRHCMRIVPPPSPGRFPAKARKPAKKEPDEARRRYSTHFQTAGSMSRPSRTAESLISVMRSGTVKSETPRAAAAEGHSMSSGPGRVIGCVAARVGRQGGRMLAAYLFVLANEQVGGCRLLPGDRGGCLRIKGFRGNVVVGSTRVIQARTAWGANMGQAGGGGFWLGACVLCVYHPSTAQQYATYAYRTRWCVAGAWCRFGVTSVG